MAVNILKQYLSEQIGDSYKNWDDKDIVIISTSTGSGKTTFIAQILLPYATKRNEKIIYICNRRALKEQDLTNFRRDLEKKYPDNPNFVDDCLDHIFVQTYQYCETAKAYPNFKNILSVKEQEKEQENGRREKTQLQNNTINAKYYIFDEAHYFICDSLFNQNTNYWNKKSFSEGINIFLTATPEPLLLYLNRNKLHETLKEFDAIYSKTSAELHDAKKFKARIIMRDGNTKTEKHTEKHRDAKRYQKAIDEHFKTYQILNDYICTRIYKNNTPSYYNSVYKNKNWILVKEQSTTKDRYDYYSPHYFQEYTHIFDILKKSVHQNEKCLIFVDNEKKGIQLREQLQNYLSLPSDTHEVVFISAPIYRRKEFNAVKIYKQIKTHQKFDCKILIATSMFDCGISIVDESIKNVVITSTDKTSFLQMLGRVRTSSKQREIDLYIQCKSEKTIAGHINANVLTMHILKELLLLNSLMCDGERASPWISEQKATTLFNRISDINNPNLYKVEANRPWHSESKSFEIIPNHNACLHILYYLYNLGFFDKRLDEPNNISLLKKQLSWIGKEYSKNNWVGYMIKCEEATAYFESLIDKWMLPEDQKLFSTKCLELLCNFPIIPPKFKENKSKFVKKKYTHLGLKKLNDWIDCFDFPYRIISKQRYIAKYKKRCTCWKVEKITVG